MRHVKDFAWDYGIVDVEGKSGTPTMGGVLILFTVGFSVFLWNDLSNHFVQILLFSVIWFGILGFIDDFLKFKQGNKTGMPEKYKLAGQALFGIALSFLYLNPAYTPVPSELTTQLFFPFIKQPVADLGIIGYSLFIILTITAISNSVNLADGLDGLAIVPSIFVASVFGIFSYVIGNKILAGHYLFEFVTGTGEVAVFSAALFGAGMGFLWFNAYPAQIIMGDIGSMSLGGILGTIAILIKQEFLFVIAGGIFVAEAFSVFVQKYVFIPHVGRRIFYRTPIHHTFQHRGLGETKVVIRFWIIAAILALISLSALKIR